MTSGEAVNWIINISADIGKAEHRGLWHYEQALSEIREMLESEPERKRGKWIKHTYHGHYDDWSDYECPVCGKVFGHFYHTNYCPNCGADMKGEEDD